MTNSSAFKEGLEHSLQMRQRVNKWFHGQYLISNDKHYVNIDLEMPISKSVIKDTFDLITLSKDSGLSIIKITQDQDPSRAIYNNLLYRVRAYLVYSQFNILPNTIEKIVIPADKTKPIEYRVLRLGLKDIKSFTETTYRSIVHIVQVIEDKVDYPNIGDNCNSCSYQSICTF